MAVRWYIAPVVTITLGNRTPFASKVLEYDPRDGTFASSSVMPNPWKPWGLSYVDAASGVHTAIAADAAIVALPDLTLEQRISAIPNNQRVALRATLEAKLIPATWIVNVTPMRDVVKYIIREALLAQVLKDDYPEAPLDDPIVNIDPTKRTRLRARALIDLGAYTSDIPDTNPVRDLVDALVRRASWPDRHTVGVDV